MGFENYFLLLNLTDPIPLIMRSIAIISNGNGPPVVCIPTVFPFPCEGCSLT